jgi:eukaryotic-like serine/threonine-protein kinase
MNLTWKIFLSTAFVVAAVLGGTLYITNKRANEAADASVDRALTATRRQAASILTSEQEQLARSAEVFAQGPPFRGVVQSGVRADAYDQSGEAVLQIGADWVQITDGSGIRLAKSDDPSAPEEDLSGSSLIRGALEGRSVSGIGSTGDTALFQAVAVPVYGTSESTIVGTLMATRSIDSTIAWAVRNGSASPGGDSAHVVIFALDPENRLQVVASTLRQKDEVAAALSGSADAMLPPITGSGPAGSLTPAESARAEGIARSGAPRTELTIGGTRYIGEAGTLKSAGGTVLGGFVALRSRDAALAPFRELERTILWAGAIGLLLSFILSFVIAAQITRPIGGLVAATRSAADGDYSAEIHVRSRDEIGKLASAFRAMLADLRDKQALVELMSARSSPNDGRTVPIRAVTPTMQLAAGMDAAVEPGQTFANRYEIVEVLGVGGMGVVYKATDRELGETVAIKTLKSDMLASDPTALERFKSEIRLARRISHRNVVRTHDLGETQGVYFITMEFVEGTSLKDLIRSRGRLPLPAILTVGKQLCRALEVAHDEGIIHRDIKPQNMVLEPGGVLKVMDFGIARLARRGASEGHTQAGMVVGTPEYMAPEQLLGDDVDARVDIWATGVVLYECATGRLPFTADSPITLISKLLETSPTPPAEVAAGVPRELSALIMRTLSRDRDQRPRNATELHDLLAAMD